MPSKLSPHMVFALLLWFSLLGRVYSLPALLSRQATGDPTTLMTVHKAETAAGTMIETCVITLTPITDVNGKPAVEEVRKCSVSMDAGNQAAGGAAPNVMSNAGIANGTPSPTNPSGSGSSTSPNPSDAAAPAVSVIGITTVPGPNSFNSGASSSVSPTSSISPSSSSSSSSSTPTPTSAANNGQSNQTPSSPSGSAAAAESSGSPTAAFALPGKKLSVLPIGLGVFAGISVIALIVVGLVTYERTKYRKAFRQRKLAESGANMGYGGMAQRT